MAPKYHPTPLSGGDRKALAKELSKTGAMANIVFVAYILARPHETSRDRPEVNRDHIVQRYGGLCLFTALLILSGAVSGIMSMARSPAALAISMYQRAPARFR